MTDEELKRLIEGTASETRRHFEVVAEGIEKKVEFLAEAMSMVDAKVETVDAKVETLRADMNKGFADTQAMIRFSHAELDRRLRTLEDVVADLQSRVERLESTTH